MLTAKAAELDRIVGLEIGADDYITKPFSPRELVLRVNKVLRRGQADQAEPDVFKFGDLLIDSPRHLVKWRAKAVRTDAHRVQAAGAPGAAPRARAVAGTIAARCLGIRQPD